MTMKCRNKMCIKLKPLQPPLHPKWEKLLPKQFTIAATENSPTLLKLKVKIKTTDMAEKNSIMSLIDCKATGEFIDRHYAKSQCFTLVKLAQPIPVYNVDGTANGGH